MMVCVVKTSRRSCSGRQFPRSLRPLVTWWRTRAFLKRLGKESFSNLPYQASGATPGGCARAPRRKRRDWVKNRKWPCSAT